jgi:hypothetical protein
VLHLHRAGDTASIRGAVVTVDHTIEAGNTDGAGLVTVPDLDDGGHIVEVVAHGYQAFEDNFNTGANIPQPIQFELRPVLASDTAKVTGQKTNLTFAGFDARRAKGQGKFFTRAQLDAASGRPLSNLLTDDAGCYAVVRDGLRIYPYAGNARPDLDKIFAEQLSGVELYTRAATVPAEVREAATCGALVLWTRDGAR